MHFWDFYIREVGRVLIPRGLVKRIVIDAESIVYETPGATYVAHYTHTALPHFMTNELEVKTPSDLIDLDYAALLEGQHPKHAREMTMLQEPTTQETETDTPASA